MSTIRDFSLGFKKGIHNFGCNITTIVNSILLTAVYVIGIGLTSLVAKILKKHFLDMKLSEKRETYWADLDLNKESIDEYYRQF
jgi:hypothetical protein